MISFFESDGAKLAYQDTGAGLPVVFLHPTPLDHDYWRPLIAEMTGIRAIVPDLRGHGASELGSGLPVGGFHLVPDAPVLTIQQLATDVLKLLDHLKVEEAVFAGCSIGGYILLELWRRAPERMQGLAFVCSKPQPDTSQAQAKRAETIAKARAEGVVGLFDGMAQSLIGATTRANHPNIVTELLSCMTVTPEAEIAVQAGLATRPDSIATVSTIRVPVLAITGGEDTSVSPEDMEVFRQAPGGCTSHLLSNAGHFAAYEQPKNVAALFTLWLHRFQR